ncbi:MAG: cellulase family glycosylhydrolase [Muribaculaceae bacterium]|nr:cellulase family glycosylhydrolase [Muribaculaceae bacterium]
MALALGACGEDKPQYDNSGWGSSGMTVKEEVMLDGNTSQTLNIKATTQPTLTCDASWLKIGEVKNITTGIYSVELTAEPNATGETRTTQVTVTAGKETATVKVTQVSGDVVEIRSIEPQGNLSPDGGSLAIKYAATGTPATNLPEWITARDTRALEDGILSLYYTPNNTGKEREGIIVLAVGKAVTNVTVRQPARTLAAISGHTATEIASDMYAGVNIGNTMECPGGEGDWSMPVNEKYVAALANMGFNAVRIPCAWDSHAKDGVIDSAWLDRVDEVVGYVIGNGMYALLNIHWDGGWLENDSKNGYSEAVDKKQHDYWTQIAEKLNHYDQRLLFAAMNEPNVDETNKAKKENSIDAIMKYEQTMLDAVRATGGNNLDRVLVMSAPNTNFELAAEGYFQMPKDVVADRLMVEAHFYGPYNFNMMEKDESWGKYAWYWGKENHVEGSGRNSTWGEEDWVKDQFRMMKEHFTDKGIPGITGEYCVCANRENDPGIDKDKWHASVRLWNKIVTEESKNAGMVPFFWETGGDIDRSNGTVKNSLQLDGVFEGAALGKYPF